MQLTPYNHGFLCCLLGWFILGNPLPILGQTDSIELPIDVNFLFNYYEQDGNHSAVTGGVGTESLTDISGVFVLNIPIDTLTTLDVTGGVNHYTSASTDNIDSYVSSASIEDNRARLELSLSKRPSGKSTIWTFSGGGSVESDYISSSLGISWAKPSSDGNREFQIGTKAYFDRWVVIFPEELRAPGLVSVPTDRRRSFSLSGTWIQVINQRLQAAFSAEWVLQNGLLSTPFHRVYFKNEDLPKIENLPNTRFKFPIGGRLHFYANDLMVLRFNYRFYWDTFNIMGHTFNLEAPIKLAPFFSLQPFYRFHTQTAAKYFAPFQSHISTANHYTSDFDLSAFYSHKYGLGIHFSPLYGIGRLKLSRRKILIFKELDLRGTAYWRSDGLRAYVIGLDMGFRL